MLTKGEIAKLFKADPSSRWGGQGGYLATNKTLDEAKKILKGLGFVEQPKLLELATSSIINGKPTTHKVTDFVYEGLYKDSTKGGAVQSKVWIRFDETTSSIYLQSTSEDLYRYTFWANRTV